ncbi:hypothetical protein BG004_007285 [Podila humilis]|nr:hypothetical protein BG004_007285 [Podila humilis]
MKMDLGTVTAKHPSQMQRHIQNQKSPTAAIAADANVTWDCGDLGSYIYTLNENLLDPKSKFKFGNTVARQVIVARAKSPNASFSWKGSCSPGQLTPLGAEQHRNLGKILREMYVDRWKLLPAHFNQDSVYVRSTDYWRTQQSAESLINGLYETQVLEGNPPFFQMEVVPGAVDYMTIKDKRCHKLRMLSEAISDSDLYRDVVDETDSYITEAKEILENVPHLLDKILPRICHKMEPYCEDGRPDHCTTQEIADLVLAKASFENAAKYRDAFDTREYLRLGFGPIAREIVDSFAEMRNYQKKSQRRTKAPRFKLYSGHDTTLTPLLGLLESSDMRWPPYASNILFELWTAPSGDQFVRIFQNGSVMKTMTKWCNLEWCPLDRFKAYMKKYIPENYSAECSADE